MSSENKSSVESSLHGQKVVKEIFPAMDVLSMIAIHYKKFRVASHVQFDIGDDEGVVFSNLNDIVTYLVKHHGQERQKASEQNAHRFQLRAGDKFYPPLLYSTDDVGFAWIDDESPAEDIKKHSDLVRKLDEQPRAGLLNIPLEIEHSFYVIYMDLRAGHKSISVVFVDHKENSEIKFECKCRVCANAHQIWSNLDNVQSEYSESEDNFEKDLT
jgi:hypothetical protein